MTRFKRASGKMSSSGGRACTMPISDVTSSWSWCYSIFEVLQDSWLTKKDIPRSSKKPFVLQLRLAHTCKALSPLRKTTRLWLTRSFSMGQLTASSKAFISASAAFPLKSLKLLHAWTSGRLHFRTYQPLSSNFCSPFMAWKYGNLNSYITVSESMYQHWYSTLLRQSGKMKTNTSVWGEWNWKTGTESHTFTLTARALSGWAWNNDVLKISFHKVMSCTRNLSLISRSSRRHHYLMWGS